MSLRLMHPHVNAQISIDVTVLPIHHMYHVRFAVAAFAPVPGAEEAPSRHLHVIQRLDLTKPRSARWHHMPAFRVDKEVAFTDLNHAA